MLRSENQSQSAEQKILPKKWRNKSLVNLLLRLGMDLRINHLKVSKMAKAPFDYTEDASAVPSKPKDTGTATPLKMPKPKANETYWHGFPNPAKK